jgi:hypothetical protein
MKFVDQFDPIELPQMKSCMQINSWMLVQMKWKSQMISVKDIGWVWSTTEIYVLSSSSCNELIHWVPFMCGNLDREVIVIHEKSIPLHWVDFIHQKFSNLIP